MSHNLLTITIFTIFFTTFTLAGPGGHGGPHKPPHGGGPKGHPNGPTGFPFLKNVTEEGRKEFQAVFRNESLTIAEMDTQVAALADKYGVSAVYHEFVANRTARIAERKKNMTDVIENVSSVASSASAIYENRNQTRKEQQEKMEKLGKEHPIEVETIMFIREKIGERRGIRGGPGEIHEQLGPHAGHGGHGPKGRSRHFY